MRISITYNRKRRKLQFPAAEGLHVLAIFPEGKLVLYFAGSAVGLPRKRTMIVKMLVVGPLASNCYIVGSSATRQGLIVDPGAEPETILRTVQQMGLSVSLIVVTHAHIDHIDGLGAVKQRTNAQFAIHEADTRLLSTAPPMSVAASLGLSPFKSAPQPDRLLKDGDRIDVGDLHFEVLHTPGHSPGGICLFGHGVVFSGDTLFNLGIGRTDFPGCSHERLMRSIHEKLMVLPDETIVYPGHGPPTTIGDERRGNPFLQDYPL
jgi:glyoxylase-like metal-dependent hydrolase (beta-lactamase superfamily II)